MKVLAFLCLKARIDAGEGEERKGKEKKGKDGEDSYAKERERCWKEEEESKGRKREAQMTGIEGRAAQAH